MPSVVCLFHQVDVGDIVESLGPRLGDLAPSAIMSSISECKATMADKAIDNVVMDPPSIKLGEDLRAQATATPRPMLLVLRSDEDHSIQHRAVIYLAMVHERTIDFVTDDGHDNVA